MKDDLSPALWRKSTFSNNTGACIEVAGFNAGRTVRDSKNLAGPTLTFSPAQWSAFTAGVRAGEFD